MTWVGEDLFSQLGPASTWDELPVPSQDWHIAPYVDAARVVGLIVGTYKLAERNMLSLWSMVGLFVVADLVTGALIASHERKQGRRKK